jgi:hypothetical protein
MSFGVDDTHYKREVAIPGIVNSVIEYECAEMSHDLLVGSFHHAVLLLGVVLGFDTDRLFLARHCSYGVGAKSLSTAFLSTVYSFIAQQEICMLG